MKKVFGFSAVFAAVMVSLIMISDAHKGATGIVKERMDSMKSIASEMKKLKKLLFDSAYYDAKAVKVAAELIKKHAKAVPAFFPKGSLKHPSEATNAIWEKFDDFKKEASRLSSFADALVLSADNPIAVNYKMKDAMELLKDLEALKKGPPQAAFFAMATTCQSCHKSYRKKK